MRARIAVFIADMGDFISLSFLGVLELDLICLSRLEGDSSRAESDSVVDKHCSDLSLGVDFASSDSLMLSSLRKETVLESSLFAMDLERLKAGSATGVSASFAFVFPLRVLLVPIE